MAPTPAGWRLNREVTLTLILTVLGTIVSVIYTLSKLEARVEAVEKAQTEAKIAAAANESKINAKLDDIQDKLDKIQAQFLVQARNDLDYERGRRKAK